MQHADVQDRLNSSLLAEQRSASTVSEYRSRVDALTRSVEDLQRQNTHLQEKLLQHQSEGTSMFSINEELAVLKAKYEQLTVEHVNLKVDASSARAQNAAMGEHIASLRRERDLLAEQLQQSKSSAQTMETRHQTATRDLQAMIESLKEQLTAARSQAAALTSPPRGTSVLQQRNAANTGLEIISPPSSSVGHGFTRTLDENFSSAPLPEQGKRSTASLAAITASSTSIPEEVLKASIFVRQERLRIAAISKLLTRIHAQLSRRRDTLAEDRKQWKADARTIASNSSDAGDDNEQLRRRLLKHVRATLNTETENINTDIQRLKASERWLQTRTQVVSRLETLIWRPASASTSAAVTGSDPVFGAWRNRTAWQNPKSIATDIDSSEPSTDSAAVLEQRLRNDLRQYMEHSSVEASEWLFVSLPDNLLADPFDAGVTRDDMFENTLQSPASVESLSDEVRTPPKKRGYAGVDGSGGRGGPTMPATAFVPPPLPPGYMYAPNNMMYADPRIMQPPAAPIQYIMMPAPMMQGNASDGVYGSGRKSRHHRRLRPSPAFASPVGSSSESSILSPHVPTRPRQRMEPTAGINFAPSFAGMFADGLLKYSSDRRDMQRKIAEHSSWLSSFKDRLITDGSRASDPPPHSHPPPVFMSMDPHPDLGVSS
jgi:hypothetical protein